jgi:hypothetical protein
MTARPDQFEAAITSAAVRALRKRAEALRKGASVGIAVLDRRPVVLVITSESATALRIAKSWDTIASDLEAESAIPARSIGERK